MERLKKTAKVIFNILIVIHMFMFVATSFNVVYLLNELQDRCYIWHLENRIETWCLRCSKVDRSEEDQEYYKNLYWHQYEEIHNEIVQTVLEEN